MPELKMIAPSKGKKRHAIVDTLGLIGVAITPADVQDTDGFIPLLKEVRRVFVFLQRIFADGGYSGANTAAEAKRAGKVELRRPTAPTLPLISGTTAGSAGSSRRKLQRLPAFT